MEAMERNLQMLKTIMEHRRNEIMLAEMSKEWDKKASLEDELKDLKVRQARLSCALWVQPEDLPSSMQLLESENPQQLQRELEATLEKLGLVPPRGALDACQLVAPTLEQAHVIAETKREQPPTTPMAAPVLEAPAPVPASAAPSAADSQQQTLALSGLKLPLRSLAQPGQAESPSKHHPHSSGQRGPRPQTPRRTSSGQKGKEGKGGKPVGDVGKGSTVALGFSDPHGSESKRFIEVCTDEADRVADTNTSGPGKGKGITAPGKGKGKKGPPMPGSALPSGEVAGKGKGKKGPALPAGKGGRIRKVTPLGRRFHWKELPADKLKGTVFDDINSSNSLEMQFEGLKNYFADDDELGKTPGAAAAKDASAITNV